MYPKVKVRTEGQDDQHAHAAHEYNWNSLLSLKDIQFLLLQDSYFPEVIVCWVMDELKEE